MFKFGRKFKESGFGTTGIVGLVSGIAALGIIANNYDTQFGLKSSRLVKARSESLQRNLSSLSIAKALLMPPKGAAAALRYGTVYPDPYLGGQNTKFRSRKLSGSGWSVQNTGGFSPIIRVENPKADELTGSQWASVMDGNTSSLPHETVEMKVVGFSRDNTNPYYIKFIDIESTNSNDISMPSSSGAASRKFVQKARVEIPPPPDPNCGLRVEQGNMTRDLMANTSTRITNILGPDNIQPVKVTAFCNHALVSARLVARGAVSENLDLDVSAFTRINPSVRKLVEKTYDTPGDYRIMFEARGVDPNSQLKITIDISIYPPCDGGRIIDGYCYYFDGPGRACSTVCDSRGGREYDEIGTKHANSSSAKCVQIINQFRPGSAFKTTWPGNSAGCKYYSGFPGFHGVYITPNVTPTAVGFAEDRRICACGKLTDQPPLPPDNELEGGPPGSEDPLDEEQCIVAGGKMIDNFCYFRGGKNQNCGGVCQARQLGYDAMGTSHANVAGKCTEVMSSLGVRLAFGRNDDGNEGGCRAYVGDAASLRGLYTSSKVSAGAQGVDQIRACSCKKIP